MSIYYERRLWEDVEAYWFCSTLDYQPICAVTKVGDAWELRFLRGSSNPGPFPYVSVEKAKKHVFRYLEPRERRITGGPSAPTANASTTHAWVIFPGSSCTRHTRAVSRGGNGGGKKTDPIPLM